MRRLVPMWAATGVALVALLVGGIVGLEWRQPPRQQPLSGRSRSRPPAPRRQPQAPVKEWSETTKRSPVRGEFDPDSRPASTPGPDPRAHRHQTTRMRTLGEPCPHHPTEKVNAWGKCPACTTGYQWAERQRQTTFKPHPEGGR